jgi:hypothetical protein
MADEKDVAAEQAAEDAEKQDNKKQESGGHQGENHVRSNKDLQ